MSKNTKVYDHLNDEQLITLNTLLQALPNVQDRKKYLEQIPSLNALIRDGEAFLLDERDYNIYSIIRIGHQKWLGENLRFKTKQYFEHPDNPHILYGYLYDWATVMASSTEFYNKKTRLSDVKHRGIAPQKWHIPTVKDWEDLEQLVLPGDSILEVIEAYNGQENPDINFRLLKAGYHWNKKNSALNYEGLHRDTSFWTATEPAEKNKKKERYAMSVSFYEANYYQYVGLLSKNVCCSCRCLAD